MMNATSIGRARRRVSTVLALGTVLAVIATGLAIAMAGAEPLQSVTSGSATYANSCTVTLDPLLQPPTTADVTAVVAANASPDPHLGAPVLVSDLRIDLTVHEDILQQAYDAGLITDGTTIPASETETIAGSNTVPATVTYASTTMATVVVMNGVVQPLRATVALPDTSWQPIDPNAPVAFTETALHIKASLPPLGDLTIGVVFDCVATTSDAFLIVPVGPGATTSSVALTTTTVSVSTTSLPATTTTTTTVPTCVRPGNGHRRPHPPHPVHPFHPVHPRPAPKHG